LVRGRDQLYSMHACEDSRWRAKLMRVDPRLTENQHAHHHARFHQITFLFGAGPWLESACPTPEYMSGRGLFNSGVVVRCLSGYFLLGLCFLSENLSSVLRGMEQRRQLRRRFLIGASFWKSCWPASRVEDWLGGRLKIWSLDGDED
jgi:hypothetical protein